VRALTEAILCLHIAFGTRQCEIDIARKQTVPANTSTRGDVDVVICTTGGAHLLQHVPLGPDVFRHRETDAEPRLLGFECHAVLKEAFGQYDYYCFLEDDILVQDPWFFVKLAEFNRVTSVRELLQPNRYELSRRELFHKAYVDGDLPPRVTAPFQNIAERPTIKGQFFQMSVELRRPLNPHSGCFFLNREQMGHWMAQPYFLDRDVSFVGPLESAATLGIMKTFRIYKPAPGCANFLEVRHADPRFIHQIGSVVRAH
jgi:hypothetical protein